MRFLLGLVAGVVLASATSLSAQDSGSWWTPNGKTGSYSHNPALGSTWIQDTDGNAGYVYTNPIPQVGAKMPCY